MKNIVIKNTLLGFCLFIGCGISSYGQILNTYKVLPAYEQARNQKLVYHIADSCLRYAKKLEAKGIQYSPKEYFKTLTLIKSYANKYNVANPSYIVVELKLVMLHGRTYIPEEIKYEITKANPCKNLKVSWKYLFGSALNGILFLLVIISFVWIIKKATLLIPKIISFVRKTRISFKLYKLDFLLKVICIETMLGVNYLSRPPNGYVSKIDKVPWFV